MPEGTMCDCREKPDLIDISDNYAEFKSSLKKLEVGNWVLLMECPNCNQLYKVDECDKYQHCYAVKIPSRSNWEQFDNEALIKEQIIKNRGGLNNASCMWAGCDLEQVKGSAFCVDHLYQGGTRA